jgi:hypothetical protein
MAKRVKRKTKRKAARRKTAVRKKRSKGASLKAQQKNKKAHWTAYKELQQRVDKAWKKLRSDVNKRVSPKILIRDKNHLLLLLGECNYMARECMRFASKGKRLR